MNVQHQLLRPEVANTLRRSLGRPAKEHLARPLEIRQLHLLDNGQPIRADRPRAFNLGTVEQMIGAIVMIDELGGGST
jgi:hypothetical protein